VARDLYQELGVSKTADAEAIRRAYRKLAKDLHPDTNPNDKASEDRFKRVNAAFDILGDPEKREKYDRGEIDADGHQTMRGFGGANGPFGGFSNGPGGFSGRFEGADFEDILGQVFGGGGPFGGIGGAQRSQPRGFDVRARLEIDLEEAILGAKKRIAFSDGRTVEVTIPPGAQNEQVLRLKGQGAAGRSGVHGDALIELVVRPHAIYRLDGADLKMDLPVSVPDAVLGARIQAPTPEGPVTLTVPKHSNSGRTLRLKGRGAVDPETGKRGDLLAELVVTLPDAADPALEAFAEQWRQERPYTPRRKA
jgi:DnaJ-class molecular chaperone